MKEIIGSVATSFAVLSSLIGTINQMWCSSRDARAWRCKNISNYEVMGLFVIRYGSEGEVDDLPVSFVDNFMCPGAFAVLGSKVLKIANNHWHGHPTISISSADNRNSVDTADNLLTRSDVEVSGTFWLAPSGVLGSFVVDLGCKAVGRSLFWKVPKQIWEHKLTLLLEKWI